MTSPSSTATNLSDSDVSPIEIPPSATITTKKRPIDNDDDDDDTKEVSKRLKKDEDDTIPERMKRSIPPKMTPRNTSTPALTATVYNNRWVYHNLFTTGEVHYAHEGDDPDAEFTELFYDCTFINDVIDRQGDRPRAIVRQGETVGMVGYVAETHTLHIFKGDGNVYIFHMATTLFGMKVEEDSQSTYSDDDDDDKENVA